MHPTRFSEAEDVLQDTKDTTRQRQQVDGVFDSENKIMPCHKVLADACSAMTTLNSFYKPLCIAIFERDMVRYPGHGSWHM